MRPRRDQKTSFQENVSGRRDRDVRERGYIPARGQNVQEGCAPHSPGLPGVTRKRFKSRNTTAAGGGREGKG